MKISSYLHALCRYIIQLCFERWQDGKFRKDSPGGNYDHLCNNCLLIVYSTFEGIYEMFIYRWLLVLSRARKPMH